ncbi:stage II sporulation protein R [Lederbergia lenta]
MDMLNDMKQGFYQKNIAWLYIFVLVIGTVISVVTPKQEIASADEAVVIPEEAIRLRILANSDSEQDQEVKRAIRDAVNVEITNWVQDLTSIDTARDVITSQLQEVEEIARQELAQMGLDYSVKVEFGDVEFPAKLYGQFLYPAGTYEAILITLGEGSGANWWCVLFPPLCFLDFSNGLAVGPGFDDSEESVETKDTEETKDIGDAKEEKGKIETGQPNVDKESDTVEKPKKTQTEEQSAPLVVDDEQKVEVRFFLSDLLAKIF